MRKYIVLFCLIFTSVCQAKSSGGLFEEILHMDAEFFDAFNRCDIEKMGQIFSSELEFYHDKGGVSDYQSTMNATRSNCDKNLGLRRNIVTDSLRVYPIKGFGAIQTGKHTFCHRENGRDDCGTFEFVHIWQRYQGGWLLARVVSFGH